MLGQNLRGGRAGEFFAGASLQHRDVKHEVDVCAYAASWPKPIPSASKSTTFKQSVSMSALIDSSCAPFSWDNSLPPPGSDEDRAGLTSRQTASAVRGTCTCIRCCHTTKSRGNETSYPRGRCWYHKAFASPLPATTEML